MNNDSQPHRPQRTLVHTDKIVLILLLLAAGFTSHLVLAMPTHTDEISVRFLQSRYFLDQGVNTSLMPQCGAAYWEQRPWFMTPALITAGLVHGSEWATTHARLIGLLNLALLLALLFGLVCRAFSDRFSKSQIAAYLLSVLSLGGLPFCLTLTRPEQSILAIAACLLLIPLCVNGAWLGHLRASLAMGFFVVVCTAFLYAYHPKTLLLSLLIGASTWSLVRHRIVRAATWVVILLISAQAFSFWTRQYYVCAEDPYLRRALATEALSPSLLGSDPAAFFTRAIANGASLSVYWEKIKFLQSYQAQWLPVQRTGFHPAHIVNAGIDVVFSTIAAAIALLSVTMVRRIWLERKMQVSQASFLAGVLSLALIAAIQESKHFYESAFVIPFSCVVFLVGFLQLATENLRRFMKLIIPVLGGLALLSQYVLWSLFSPVAESTWRTPGYLGDGTLFVSFAGFAEARSQILETARRCGIATDASSRHVVVDDVTYAPLIHTSQPFHASYVGGAWGVGIRDPRAFFTKWGSSGILVDCRLYPEALNSGMVKHGSFCCHGSFVQDSK